MREIITDLEVLKKPSVPAEFIKLVSNDIKDVKLDDTATAEYQTIIDELKEILSSREDLLSLAAPQIGYNKRIFCIKFSDCIKTFINPIITKKSKDKFINFEKHVDGDSYVYVCRPSEIKAVFYSDEFKYEENTLKDGTAALFSLNANLLDGVIAGNALNIDADNVVLEDLPSIVDATYTGSGIIVDKDTQLDLEEVANILNLYMNSFDNYLEEICSQEEESDFRKAAREFRLYERVALGDVTSLDGLNLEKELRDMRAQAAGERKHNMKKFVSGLKKNRGKR